MSDSPDAVFYPRYCFHLAPTVNAWCFLRTRELFALDQRDGFEGEGLYFHRNLPIKWVRVVGVVVAMDDFAGRRAFTVDDSSGACIEAIISLAAPVNAAEPAPPVGVLAPPPVTSYDHIDVGSVVDVKGALTTFRDAKQLKVEKMTALRSTAEEMKLWVKRSAFRRNVLEKPWILPDKTVRKCRKDAERTEAEAERRRQRLKAASGSKSDKSGKLQGAKSANKDRREQGSRQRRDGAEVAEALASSKGQYHALGL